MAFSIYSSDYNFRINDVEHRGQLYRVSLTDKFNFIGKPNQHTEHTKQAIKSNKPHTVSLPFYHDLFTNLFRNRNGEFKEEIEQARQFIRKIMFENIFSTTLTTVNYQSKGKDEVIHDCGLDSQEIILENIVGPNEFIKDSKTSSVYKALLGTDNIKEINQIYDWLLNNNPKLWPLNKKPKKIDRRVAGFDAFSGGVGLSCNGGPGARFIRSG
ncbi:MAG: hypothetical protein ISS82_03095 [Nanoarchaeota archaeon]|nr:hypothetical protein [Nanoarchaeota archaeon]